MAAPTVTVAVTLLGPAGSPIVGARVTAQLSATVAYQGVVLPDAFVAETGATGQCALHLVPTDLHGQSTYTFEIWPADSPTPYAFANVAVPSTPASTTLTALLGGVETLSLTYWQGSISWDGSLHWG